MAIKFKAIERGEPGVTGGGTKKFYASPVYNTEDYSLEKITRGVEKSSTVSGADIRAVLYASVEDVSDALKEGYIVRFGDLGSFRVSISSEGVTAEEELTESNIKEARVLFTPGSKLKEMLATLKYKKT